MAGNNDRINGWKAIGAHFGRDRTTVMRWAQERGLPVRRIPGGKASTVYALKSELDAWASSQSSLEEATDAGAATEAAEADADLDVELATTEPAATAAASAAPVATPAERSTSAPSAPARRVWPYALVVVLFAVALAAWLLQPATGTPPAAALSLPRDPKAAELFIDARNNWALRTTATLESAITAFEAVVELEPGFAPAHAGLADAYLLAREFGSMPDAIAFAKAQAAVARALELDTDLPAAHRAQGFIRYWHEHDSAAAGRSFRRAIELNPQDAQTRFWYGNILADNGEQAAASRELNVARLLEPGSVAIETDAIWALWSAGDSARAIEQMRAVIQREPGFAVARDCMSLFLLGEGDIEGYVNEFSERARLRAEPDLVAHAQQLQRALANGGAAAVHDAMIARAMVDQTRDAFPDHSWAAFVASLTGDREKLLGVLRLADAQRQIWGAAGFTLRIQRRWDGDAEIQRLLEARRAARIESSN